jgi:hypothetical protein
VASGGRRWLCKEFTDVETLSFGHFRVTSLQWINCREIVGGKECEVTITAEGLPWEGVLLEGDGSFYGKLEGVRIKAPIDSEACTKEGETEISGNLEGKWNNATATFEFPETPLEGSTLKTGGETVTVSAGDEFELEKSEPLEIREELNFATGLVGETYPIVAEGSITAKAEKEIALETATEDLEAKKVSALVTVQEWTSLAELGIAFTGVKELKGEKTECKSEGQAAGVVLVPSASMELVLTNYAPEEVGALISFPPFTVTCAGGLTVKLTAPSLGKLIPVVAAGEEGESTAFDIGAHCMSPGVAELKSSYTVAAEFTTLTLLANFGTGNVAACQEMKETLLVGLSSSSKTKMFTILY